MDSPVVRARACAEAEAGLLTRWSVSTLPACLAWTAGRALRPPAGIVDLLQEMRFGSVSVPDIAADLLAEARQSGRHGERPGHGLDQGSTMRDIAGRLSRDLESFCRWAEGADGHDSGTAMMTASRDLIRMRAALDYLRLDQVELVGCPTLLVPAFLAAKPTLYVPAWLADSLPTAMFEPRDPFELVRPTSLCWLLFDAVAIAPADGFRTVYELYGTRQ